MCLERTLHAKAQAGFSLLTGIFLLVILAALGAFLVTVSGLLQFGSAMDMQGARAYQAARAGIEWGAFQSLRGGSCAASANLAFPGTGLANFTATVRCTAVTASELGAILNLDEITATACNQPDGAGACPNNAATGTNYIERQITVKVDR
jgi:MSHA biogenesis protein MshP